MLRSNLPERSRGPNAKASGDELRVAEALPLRTNLAESSKGPNAKASGDKLRKVEA
jgi:hypothetical protein